ncbi:PLP-dependent aminotransferase family protein [Kitasatospora nipponensis]|uniref:PLP-dependent aminotransferase family protein n=1 Tax=Kitasatospora nipponensis TaxID=258049 RepID=A0ABN1WI43_9ACTN
MRTKGQEPASNRVFPNSGGLLPERDLVVREGDEEPLYHQIYTQLRHLIVRSGRLPPGTRLPSSRVLAGALGVSRNTVLLAYQRLQEDGHVQGRAGGGTLVSGPPARATPAGLTPGGATPGAGTVGGATAGGGAVIRRPVRSQRRSPAAAFPLDVPPLDLFPVQLWTTLTSRRLRLSGERLLLGTDRLGLPALRVAIAAFLGVTRGIACAPEQVVVTRGIEAGLELVARSVLDAGDPVWCEDPGDPRLRELLSWHGAKPCAVPVDGAGLDIAAGVRQAPHARLAVLSAAHQLPLGAELSAARRAALLRHADRQGMWIVDVERDGPFLGPRAARPLWSEDTGGRVIQLGGFNSLLFPQIQCGFCVLPPELLDRVDRVAGGTDSGASAITQAALADFLDHHRFAAFLHRGAQACAGRRLALLDTLRQLGLDEHDVMGHQQGGSFLSVLLPGAGAAHPGLRDPSRPWPPRPTRVPPTAGGPATAAGHPLAAPARLGRYAFRRPELDGFVLGYASLREEQVPGAVRAWAPLLAAGSRVPGRLAG